MNIFHSFTAYLKGRIINDIKSTNDIMNTMIDCLPVFFTILFTWVRPKRALKRMKMPMKRR